MTFQTLALFALVNAAFASSIARAPAAAAVAQAESAAGLSPEAITVLETCVNENLSNCLIWTATTLPVGCTSLAANGQASDVSSVSSSTGIECTFFTSTTCTGSSQIINGTIDTLTVVAFDNLANSFTCQSS
ncbi:hypothetical protein B0H17DRAFT_1131421 [Mycena rosella]|uniref:Uncharacterized protein n=1 Tax=Mycena rosella TaxID=1033263 RepID=A0AAD7DPU6_MYCRO|nr:hypothetical protein B0H17DRAFT_1131421 [Mycena rosella]